MFCDTEFSFVATLKGFLEDAAEIESEEISADKVEEIPILSDPAENSDTRYSLNGERASAEVIVSDCVTVKGDATSDPAVAESGGVAVFTFMADNCGSGSTVSC